MGGFCCCCESKTDDETFTDIENAAGSSPSAARSCDKCVNESVKLTWKDLRRYRVEPHQTADHDAAFNRAGAPRCKFCKEEERTLADVFAAGGVDAVNHNSSTHAALFPVEEPSRMSCDRCSRAGACWESLRKEGVMPHNTSGHEAAFEAAGPPKCSLCKQQGQPSRADLLEMGGLPALKHTKRTHAKFLAVERSAVACTRCVRGGVAEWARLLPHGIREHPTADHNRAFAKARSPRCAKCEADCRNLGELFELGGIEAVEHYKSTHSKWFKGAGGRGGNNQKGRKGVTGGKEVVYQRYVAGRARDQEDVEKTLLKLVRDAQAGRHIAPLVERYGDHDHYLRHTAARRMRYTTSQLDVDHILEGQLLTHALVQTPKLHSRLNQLNTSSGNLVPLRDQPEVVKALLEPVHRVHNSGADLEFFNFRPTTHKINMQKKAWIETFIKTLGDEGALQAQKECQGQHGNTPLDLQHELVRQLSTKRKGETALDSHEAEVAADAMMKELADTEAKYVDHLHGSGSSLLEPLAEQLGEVYDTMAGLYY